MTSPHLRDHDARAPYDRRVLVVAARRGPQTINVENVVDHELAHLALGAALGERAPRWLHEGFAYQHSAEWSLERTRTLTLDWDWFWRRL